jgi:hypothetical protein
MRNILKQSYTPEQIGPMQPGVQREPSRFDRPGAVNALLGGGFIPEAQAIGQPAGGFPAAVQEFEYWKKLPTKEAKEQYLKVKRAQKILDLGGSYGAAGMTDPSEITPVAEKTLRPTEETDYITEAERTKILGRESGKLATESFSRAQKIGENIVNLEKVITLVDKEGASTGPLMSRLPSFRAASVELDNMQKQLGLEIISAVTFGALSEKELEVALSTALPTHLRGPELIQWSKDKVAAQKKLRDYLEEQAMYMSQPGSTQAGWIEQQKTQRQPEKPIGEMTDEELEALISGQ